MSVKAMALVWDLPCPSEIGGIEFKPGHKYVLIAYADHADHHGRNIYPAVETIAKKTGYEVRSVQRLTRDLQDMKLLVSNGSGPRGTNRFYIPFNQGGDKISPLTKFQGDNNDKSLGDIPSGDIPSGAILSPELKNLNPEKLHISNNIKKVWGDAKEKLKTELPKASFETWVNDTETLGVVDRYLVVVARNTYAKDWLSRSIQDQANAASGYFVWFVAPVDVDQTAEA
ncbi:MAG: hypothetical protein EDM79_19195 [Chloroflexi bacterium]|nr:MAG: hypothetical protein EDM79_19195 [Chloroflexota bacterium]